MIRNYHIPDNHSPSCKWEVIYQLVHLTAALHCCSYSTELPLSILLVVASFSCSNFCFSCQNHYVFLKLLHLLAYSLVSSTLATYCSSACSNLLQFIRSLFCVCMSSSVESNFWYFLLISLFEFRHFCKFSFLSKQWSMIACNSSLSLNKLC